MSRELKYDVLAQFIIDNYPVSEVKSLLIELFKLQDESDNIKLADRLGYFEEE